MESLAVGTESLMHMYFALISPYWRGFRAVLPHAHYPRSQGTMMDDEGVIYLRQRVVNVMQSGCRVMSQKREGYETTLYYYQNSSLLFG